MRKNARNKIKWKRDKKKSPFLRSSKCNDLLERKRMKFDQLSEFMSTQTYERRMNDQWMMRWILSVMLWSMFETHGRVEWMKRSSLKGLIDERMNEPMNAVNERTNKWTINPGGYARGALAEKYCKEFWKRRTHLRWEKRMHAIEERKKNEFRVNYTRCV